ncbi:MAG TPA: UDP-N-acetylglucosamine 2-epimerase (non-hydrolyzing) [Acidobacteriota bacterium]|nr:UDP-N-acetylglucosamine 2-epimerase (non-hydrolyzing) [Acidobacteriota bacterium]
MRAGTHTGTGGAAAVCCIVGARPNFMKMAPVLEALRARPSLAPFLVHTGQHYDDAMSRVFFEELGLPRPDHDLGVGSGSHAVQTAGVMVALDRLLDERPADLVVVVGDVNSTLAGALVASKRGIPVAHVEAGLRSRDRGMPEELNRIVTDALADLLFATCSDAVENLLLEGVPRERIHLTGNPMIDTLRRHVAAARRREVAGRFGLPARGFALVTLHRPSNVDDPERLGAIVDRMEEIGASLPVLFPVHPRTRDRLARLGRVDRGGVRYIEPLGYPDFLGLLDACRFVLTDSGGIQEESTALGVPCLTLRANTERPVTVTEGTNRLVGEYLDALPGYVGEILRGPARGRTGPALWDGRAGERIAAVLDAYLEDPLPRGLTAPEMVDKLND